MKDAPAYPPRLVDKQTVTHLCELLDRFNACDTPAWEKRELAVEIWVILRGELVERHDLALEANNQQARAEKAERRFYVASNRGKYLSTHIQQIAKLPPHEQVHFGREYRAELRNHPAFTNDRHPDHKHIVEELHKTYQTETYTDGTHGAE